VPVHSQGQGSLRTRARSEGARRARGNVRRKGRVDAGGGKAVSGADVELVEGVARTTL